MPDGSGNFTQKDGVSLRDYVDTRISALEKSTAITYASMNDRLATMNEFRASMSDMAARSVTRLEFDQLRERLPALATCLEVDNLADHVEKMRQIRESQIKSLEEEIQSLSEFRAELRGKASQSSVMVALGISALGALLSIVSLMEKLAK